MLKQDRMDRIYLGVTDFPTDRIQLRVSLNYFFTPLIWVLVAARYWDQRKRRHVRVRSFGVTLENVCILFIAVNYLIWTALQGWMGSATISWIKTKNMYQLVALKPIQKRQKVTLPIQHP